MEIIDINKIIEELNIKLENTINLNQEEKLLIKSLLVQFKESAHDHKSYSEWAENDIIYNNVKKEILNQLIKIENFLNKKSEYKIKEK